MQSALNLYNHISNISGLTFLKNPIQNTVNTPSKIITGKWVISSNLATCINGSPVKTKAAATITPLNNTARDIIYWESANIVAILSFSFFFSMLKDSAFIGLQIVKRTKIAGLLITLSSLINLGLNILLIPRFSIYGAAIATLF